MTPLATTADLRRLSGAAWPDEAAAQALIDAASSAVRSYCGWSITEELEAEAVVDARGGHVLPLPTLHLTAVHLVEVEGSAVDDYSWSASGLLYRPVRWPHAYRSVRATYDHGYTTAPPELTAVVCGLAARLPVPAGVASWSVGSQTVTFNSEGGPGLATVEESVLDRYRIFEA